MLRHRLPPISEELKDHEQELLRTIFSLLLDDAEPNDWTTFLFWRAPIASHGKCLSFDMRSSPALLMLRNEVLRWLWNGTVLNGIFDSLELFSQRRAKQNTHLWNQSREDSPPPKRTGNLLPPDFPSAALPDEHACIHGIERMYRCVLSKNQSDPGRNAIRTVK